MIAELFNRAVKRRADEKELAFLNLAKREAAGEKVNTEEAVAILAGAKKTVDEYNSLVNVMRRRALARKRIAELPTAMASQQQKQSALQAEYDKLSSQCERLRNGIRQIETDRQASNSQFDGERKYLIESCPDKSLVAECNKARANFHLLNMRLSRANQAVQKNADWQKHVGKTRLVPVSPDQQNEQGFDHFAKPHGDGVKFHIDDGKRMGCLHGAAVKERDEVSRLLAAMTGDGHPDDLLSAA